MRPQPLASLGALLAAVALTACGAPAASPSPSAVSATSAARPSTASPTAAGTPETINQACDVKTEFTEKELGRKGGPLMGAMRGTGDTAVILLHQTNEKAMCGWASRAEFFDAQQVRMVLIDLCGYGRSKCSGMTWAEQVGAAAAWARESGAKRIVLLGASMGGTAAVKTAPDVKADAVISLSGPESFQEGSLKKDATLLTMPTLFVYSDADLSDLRAANLTLPSIPAQHKKLLEAKRGHGFSTLGDDAVKDAIRNWIAGSYA